MLNQVYSFTPLLLNITWCQKKIDIDRLKPPKPINLDGNLLQNWKSWKQGFILFMTAAEYDEKPDNVKSSLLLHCIGERARGAYNTCNFSTTADSMKLDKSIETVRNQETGESFDDCMTELRKLSSDCELEGLQESLLTDMPITGLNDKLKERLLRESNLDLNKMVEIC